MKKNLPPHAFRNKGKIYREQWTQARGGDPRVLGTPKDIIQSINFARVILESEEKYAAGTFQGRDRIDLHFRTPGWDVHIQQGDKAEVTFNQKTITYNIDGVVLPDDMRDDWVINCSIKVDKVG